MNIYAIIAAAVLVVLGLIGYQQAEIYRLEKSLAKWQIKADELQKLQAESSARLAICTGQLKSIECKLDIQDHKTEVQAIRTATAEKKKEIVELKKTFPDAEKKLERVKHDQDWFFNYK